MTEEQNYNNTKKPEMCTIKILSEQKLYGILDKGVEDYAMVHPFSVILKKWQNIQN